MRLAPTHLSQCCALGLNPCSMGGFGIAIHRSAGSLTVFNRIAVTSIVVAATIGAARAESARHSILSAVPDVSGDTARGCLVLAKPVAAEADRPASDYVAVKPAVRASIEARGDQICVSGLAYGARYSLTLRAGLAFADGGRQGADETAELDVPDRDPTVAVGGRGWILPRQGSTGVTVQTINVARVRVRVLRVSERRLTAGMAADGERTARPDPAKQSFMLYELRNLVASKATEVWSGTMQANPGRNQTVETAFPLAGIVDPAKPGAFIVLAEDAASPPVALTRPDGQWDPEEDRIAIAGHWVLSTDLGLSTMWGLDGLRVGVRSLGSAAAMPGVRLQLLSVAQDVLGEAATTAEGEAVFPPGLLRGRNAAVPSVVLARTDAGDMAVQELGGPAFDLSDRGAEGRVSPGPVEAYVYTDRGIYRPGETVQVMALLRQRGLAAVDDAGLMLVLRRPDGVEASRTTLPPAPASGFQRSLALAASAAQGNWTVEAYLDPSLPAVGRATVAVQDFVPQQLAVTLTGPGQPLAPGARLTAAIAGRFLYGAPAAGLHAEGTVTLVRDEHPVADAAGYSFGDPNEAVPDAVQVLQLPDADAAGQVAVDAALKLPGGIASPLRAVLDAGLTEPGGRAVRDSVSVPLRNHPVLVGLRPMFSGRVNAGDSSQFDVRAFAADGQPVARPGLQWRMVRLTPHWNWWRPEAGRGGWLFHQYTTEDDIAHGTLDVAADGPARLERVLEWGNYRLVVSDRDSGAASSAAFAVGWGARPDATDVPDQLEVAADRAVAAVGQAVRVHVRGPFAGPARVVVESAGRVLERRDLALSADGGTVDLVASADWGPGVHVLAEAFRPLAAAAGAHDPVRAMGLAWVATDPAPHTLAVSVASPAITAPRRAVPVAVHVAGAHGRAFVTLSAVDEGILQLTRFATPDPVAALLGRTRFGLDLRDSYGRLLVGQAGAGALREGGDDGAALGGGGLPVTTTRVVALFQGPVELDMQGNATVTLDLPDFAGELRLMAVAYDREAAGHAEARMTVRDPVVAEMALPRFLAPGDRADTLASLHNTDGPAGDYRLALTAGGAVRLPGLQGEDIHLDAGERREVRVALEGVEVGIGHLRAVLTGPGGMQVEHGWDIAVRSPHADLVLSQTDTQRPGETYTVDPAMLAAFVPGSAQVTVGYSADGLLDVPGLLQSLYAYPYGCTEQLASSALPLLYFNDARLLGRPAGDPALRQRVQTAIDTMVNRQDAGGRFGLWRAGDGAGSVWLNVYALDFLLRARDAGFDVPGRVTGASAQWIDRHLDGDAADLGSVHSEPAPPTRAYAAYVLARTDRIDPARLRELAGGLEWGKADGRPVAVSWRDVGLASPLSLAELAGAQSLMGMAAASDATFALAVANLDAPAVPDWWRAAFFWTPLRDEAGVLAVAAETGHDAVVASLLNRLRRANLAPERMNTQEKAWLLSAAHALARWGGSRSLSVDGAPAQAVALPYAVSPSADHVARGASVRNAGDGPVFRTVTVRGAPTADPGAMANGFSIHRQALTLNGDPLDDSGLRQTDRFLVVLTGAAEGDEFRRVVVSDLLPAGLEIEAPVLREDSYPFLGQLTGLRAHEERDDRFVAAFDLGRDEDRPLDRDRAGALDAGSFRVAYVVRAVTPGRFVQPETVVQDMYRPDVMARTAARQTEVAPR